MGSFSKNVAISLVAAFLVSSTCIFASAGKDDTTIVIPKGVYQVNYLGCKYLVNKEDGDSRFKLLEIFQLDKQQNLNLPSDVIVDNDTISYDDSQYDYFYKINVLDNDCDIDKIELISELQEKQSSVEVCVIEVRALEYTQYFVKHDLLQQYN